MKIYNKIINFLVERKKSYAKYYIAGLILTGWGLITIWILVDIIGMSGVMFIIIMTPINWILKPVLYSVIGVIREDK